jgi:predicted MPP superfamily phosphohydrolase
MEPKALKNFLSQLSNMGVKVLHDEAIPFRGGTLVGIKDPHSKQHTLRHLLRKTEPSDFVLLLAHKPHYFHNYLEADLILTGHAHGGQMRLPWIGGVFAPGQGYFPKYTKGFYEMEGSTMLVSGGIGNSHRIPRVFNPPELVLLTLRSQ